MAQQEHLKNAPITEAILDIRVRVSDTDNLKSLQSLFPLVSDSYPKTKKRHQMIGRIEMREGQTPSTAVTGAIDGLLFLTPEGNQIFQARKDGFTFNRLKPYENWEKFQNEAKRLWRLYKEATSPEIQRISLRYINRIDIPIPVEDFGDYLVAAPVVPKDLPQGINSFLTRVVITEPTTNANAIITQVFEQVVDPRFLPIFLDIDVIKQTESIEEDEVWDTFEMLREFKNKIFFSSITDKMKELFL